MTNSVRKKRKAKPYPLGMTPERIAAARTEINALLRTERREWARKRLTGVNALLSCQPLKVAACSVDVKTDTVSGWFRSFRDGGCAALLSNPPAYEAHLPVMDSREVARVRRAVARLLQRHPKPDARSQQRLRAVLVALAGNTSEAADSGYVRPATVRHWLRIVHQHGPAALLEKRHPGRPSRRSASLSNNR